MAKILEIHQPEHYVVIGMDDGGIRDVPADALNFVPHLEDQVEIFETSTRIINKPEPQENFMRQASCQGTPNITINNVNTNTNTNTIHGGGRAVNKWGAFFLASVSGSSARISFTRARRGWAKMREPNP